MDIRFTRATRCSAAFGLIAVLGLGGLAAAGASASDLAYPKSEEVTFLTSFDNADDAAGTPSTECVSEGCVSGAAGCGTGRCGERGTGCCGNWLVGVEAVWLSPQQDFAAGSVAVENDGDVVVSHHPDANGTDGLYLTPRIWLGYQGRTWGVRTRYWRMNEGDTNLTQPVPQFDAPGQSASHDFFAETLDLELTRKFYTRNSEMVASVGVRYAQLRQDTQFEAIGYFDGGTEMFAGGVRSLQEFSGTGITFALEGSRPTRYRNFELFYSLRFSALWDDDGQVLTQTQARYSGVGSAEAYNAALARGDSELYIGEVQVGGQWVFPLKNRPAQAFIRTTVEYQYWDTDDTGHATAISAAGPPPTFAVARGQANTTTVDLIGFSVATGLTY